MAQEVQVAVRIRPLVQQEIDRGCEECIVVPGNGSINIKEIAFTYNFVFPPHITQQEFYDTAVKSHIGKLFEGYNVTILAYGKTGSGKTFTMGTDYSGSDGDSTKHGVIPQAVADIFDFVETNKDKFEFKVHVSFLELYKELCFDLLSEKERAHSIIEIREDRNKGVILPGLSELPVASTMETMTALARGSSSRVTGSTAMNQASSRSHAVFTIVIAKESRTDKNQVTTAKFHIVDLAGSERIKKTNASRERLQEGVKINKGLLALGKVISALGDGTSKKFINYRDSKLTRLLQDSLGGNSFTLMVACVSPADCNLDETVSTLRYADRARRIRNKPIINQDPKTAEILRLKKIINELRLELLGQLPTVSEQNTEQLEIELERERTKYTELLKQHKKTTEHLATITENTNLCEKALLAEAAKDSIDRKVNELTEHCDQTLENLNGLSSPDDEHQKKIVDIIVDYIKEIKILLDSVKIKLSSESHSQASNDDDDGGVMVDAVDDQTTVEEEEKRAMEHITTPVASGSGVVQTQPAVEEEPTKDRLESSNLKQLVQQQAQIIKMNEAKVASLNAELQTMRIAKIKIIKQMREESEKFRKRETDNEHAMLRLKKEDSKRVTVMAQVESVRTKQLNVLKQRMEQTVAVNKRLKEALERRNQVQNKRNAKGFEKVGPLQAFIKQELEEITTPVASGSGVVQTQPAVEEEPTTTPVAPVGTTQGEPAADEELLTMLLELLHL